MTSRRGATITAVLLAALVCGGMALRLYGLGERGFWLDETFSELRTRADLHRTVSEALDREGSPPLYLAVLWGWRRLVGTGEARFRGLSAALDGLTVLAVFALARQVLNRPASLLAAGMYAFSSFAIFYAQEARQYALFALLSTLSSHFFVRIALSGRKIRIYHYFFYVISTVAALYTFPYAAFVFAAQWLYFLLPRLSGLLSFLRKGRGRRRERAWGVEICLLLSLIAFIPYLGVLARRAAQLRSVGGEYAGVLLQALQVLRMLPAVLRDAFYGHDLPFVGGGWAEIPTALLFAAAPVALGVLYLRCLRGARTYFLSVFGVSLICLLLFPFQAHLIEAKHLIFALPLAFISLCALFSYAPNGPGGAPRWVPLLGGLIALAVFAGVQAYALVDYYGGPVEKEAWREFAPALVQQLQAGDKIVFSPFQGAVPFEYYLPDKVRREEGPFRPRGWSVAGDDGRRVRFEICTPLRDWSSGPVYHTSYSFERMLEPERTPRVWLVTNHSKVAREVRWVAEVIEKVLAEGYDEVHPGGVREEYRGSLGTIRVRLFERKARAGRTARGGP